ncbi:MAG: GIY-YIG nuclease family protein [Promethearchaeota archaeon]
MQDNDMTFVYLIECANRSIYTGVTNDIGKRLKEHIEGKGARYTAMHGVKQLLAVWPCKNRSSALKLEIKVKITSHEEKQELVDRWNDPFTEYPFPDALWKKISKGKGSQDQFHRDQAAFSQTLQALAKLA